MGALPQGKLATTAADNDRIAPFCAVSRQIGTGTNLGEFHGAGALHYSKT